MNRGKLYTVNKWNRLAFMPEKNLFFGGGQSGIAGQAGLNASLPPLESYLPKGLSEDTYRNLAIGSMGQMQNAFHNYGKSVVDNFGKGNIFKTNNGPTINSQDASSFFGKDLSLNPEGASDSAKAVKSGFKGAAMQAAGATALNALGSIDTGERNGLFDTLDPVYHLAGGRESKVGNALSDTGVSLTKSGNPWLMLAGAGLKIIGGLTNAAFGLKENKELKQAADASIKSNSSFISNADSFDDIKGPVSKTGTNIYDNGWFTSEADEKNAEYNQMMNDAYSWAERSIANNVYNLSHDQIADFERNYSAYGGPLDFGGGALGLMQQNRYFDTIDKRSDAIANKNQMPNTFTTSAKTFADGGLKATFMDEFGKDPIGAAVRYNQGLERMAAQKEAAEAEAAREAEQLAMQQRLANLETQNQGLQALMAAQTMPAIPEVQEAPVSSPTPSSATRRASSGNSTWDYVEDQLRRSGKFNDVQIEGIKYNLQRESSIDPTAVGDGGQAFGLGQWHGARKPSDMSLEGQTQHLIDTLSNYDGRMHWIGEDNYRGFMNARTPEEAHYYITRGYERPRADIVAKVKRDSDMSLKRLNAFGGELGTNGTDWTNGLLYIDEGGSHESNPFDGVPMGVDAEGIPNLVEEGETVYNNYVFSDRMNVPDFMYKELGLGGTFKKKGKGMSFADASKKLAQESEQRPNDPISQDGLEASLSRLAEVQETERMKKNAEEYMGLKEYACGGKMNKHACGGPKGKMYWGWGDTPNYLGWLPEYRNTEPLPLTPVEAAEQYAKQQAEQQQAASKQTVSKPVIRKADTTRSSNNPYSRSVETPQAPTKAMTDEEFRREYPLIARAAEEKPQGIDYTDGSVWQGLGAQPATGESMQQQTAPVNEEYNPYPTWMRYAPVVGAGAMALTDMLGLTNSPDYTYADKLEAAANGAAYAPNIQYKPIGDYMRYTPLDRMFQQNQLNAIARSADRTIMNSSLPTASKYAALLAANYNNQLSAGNLFRQAQEYNRGMYERTKDFNRKTNMFNSQLDLEAAMANARYRQQAQQFGLSGLAQAAALRDSIDARTGAAKAANLSNFFTSLGNIGRENFAMNQINNDKAWDYGITSRGTSPHKKSSKGKKNSRWF